MATVTTGLTAAILVTPVTTPSTTPDTVPVTVVAAEATIGVVVATAGLAGAAVRSARTSPSVRLATVASPTSPEPPSLTAVPGVALVFWRVAPSAVIRDDGLSLAMNTVFPPSTRRDMPPCTADTSTAPSITWTALRSGPTTTVKVVPLTTAASIGVSTRKWGLPVLRTLNNIVPISWIRLVHPPCCAFAGSNSRLLGAMTM